MRLPRTLGLYAAHTPRERFGRVCYRACFWTGRLAAALVPAGLRPATDDAAEEDEMVSHIRRLSQSQPVGVWRYRPQPYVGPVAAFLSQDTGTWPLPDRRPLWRAVSEGGFDLIVIPGEHHHALEEPHAAGAARALRRFIDSVLGGRGPAGR
jgi:hypothetical protein